LCLSDIIWTMSILLGIYSFVVGTAFGSFALAMADRMKKGEDWVRGRSKCDHCGHKLSSRDLVPIFSWLSQKGKCRYCRKKLSIFYPLVELGTGLAFLGSYIFAPYELTGLSSVMFVLWLLGLVIMAGLVVFDLRWYLLPNKLVYPLIAVAATHRIIAFFAFNEVFSEVVLPTLLSLLIGSGLFWALHKISKGKWIGDGDYRLGFAIALFLADPLTTWLSLFAASVFGLMIMLPMLFRGKSKKKLKIKIPFGPFLILGLYFSYLFGERLIDWYINTFLHL